MKIHQVIILPQYDDFSLCFWAASTSEDVCGITSCNKRRCCIVGNRWLFVICLSTVALRSCDRDGLSLLLGVSAHQVTNRRFLWACDGVKTRLWRRRRRPADVSSVNIGFFGSPGVNHWGNFPLTESPAVKMLAPPPGVAFPYFLTTYTDDITFSPA